MPRARTADPVIYNWDNTKSIDIYIFFVIKKLLSYSTFTFNLTSAILVNPVVLKHSVSFLSSSDEEKLNALHLV